MEQVSTGKLIGMAKRKWKESKRVTSYEDELSREENALFKDDSKLVGLCLDLKLKEQEIIDYIDDTITLYRQEEYEKTFVGEGGSG